VPFSEFESEQLEKYHQALRNEEVALPAEWVRFT